MLPPFRLLRPRTLAEAIEVVSEDEVPYCGGTELLLAMRAGLHRPDSLVDIKGVPELTGIAVVGDELVIGAAERHMDIAGHALVRELVPMLASVEGAVGNARVRAQGSIGGNLCFAEPKSDVGTALMALGGTVTLAGPSGRRRLAVSDLLAGPYFADKEPNEVMVDVRLPIPGADTLATYLKFQTMERPTVGVALVDDRGAGHCLLAVGAVGEVPMLWTFRSATEIDPDAIAEAVDPTPDLGGSERYKRHVTSVYVRRAVARLVEEAA